MGLCWTSSQILFSSFRAWDTWVLYVSTIVGVPSVCVLVRLFLYRTVSVFEAYMSDQWFYDCLFVSP